MTFNRAQVLRTTQDAVTADGNTTVPAGSRVAVVKVLDNALDVRVDDKDNPTHKTRVIVDVAHVVTTIRGRPKKSQ